MDRELERFFPSGCFLFQLWGCPASALTVAGKGGGVLRAHPFFGTVAWCLFKSLLFPSTLPGVVMTFPVCLPRAPALRQVLVAMLAEGALESPSVLVLAFHSSLFLVEGSSDGSAPGDHFLSPGLVCSFTPFRLRSVASVLFLLGSGLFFLLWFCRFTVGSSGAFPRGNFWGSREGWVFQFSPWGVLFDFVPVLSWVFSPGFDRVPPSPGCDFTGLVAWSLLAPRSWKPPCQSTPFARSIVHWRWCGANDSLPLVSSLSAARFG